MPGVGAVTVKADRGSDAEATLLPGAQRAHDELEDRVRKIELRIQLWTDVAERLTKTVRDVHSIVKTMQSRLDEMEEP